ncbi:MAG: SPOR domain-containing protein [Flectobacillus sp.]|nr:SPOR domain-containing protein [Flectobacillus sp.]
MKKIQEYIKDLLFEQDCVVIPDFGGFVANYEESKLEDAIAKPARKWFAFNELLRTDDGILSTYIIQQEKISRTEASQKIKDYVTYIRQTMRNDDYLFIRDLGSFCLNEENKIQFIPVYNIDFSSNSFGISSFALTKMAQPAKVTYEQPKLVILPTKALTESVSNQAVFDNVSIANTPTVEVSPVISFKKVEAKENRKEYFFIASAVAMIALFLSFYIYDNKGFTLSNLNFFTTYKYPVYTWVSSETKNEKLVRNTTKSAPVIQELDIQQNPKYFVIVGSFESKKNAELFMSKLKSDGYEKAQLIGEHKKSNKIKVSLDYYNTKDEAVKKAATLDKAWIYTTDLLP